MALGTPTVATAVVEGATSPQTSASFTPPDNALVIIVAAVTGSAISNGAMSFSTTITSTGQSALTTVNANTATATTASCALAYFTTGTGATAGTCTVTYGSDTPADCRMTVITITGVDTTTPVTGTVSDNNILTDAFSLTTTTTPTTADYLFGLACARNVSAAATPGTGFTDTVNSNGAANPRVLLLAEYRGNTTSTTVDGSGLGTLQHAAIGLVVKASSTTNATVTPAAIAALSAVPAPTVQTGSTVSPTVVASLAAVPAVAISTATHATVTPTAIAAVAAVAAPSLQTSSTISATTVGAITAIGSPVVRAGSTVTPAAIAAVTAVGTPTVSIGATVSVSAVAALTALPTVTLSTGSTVAATAVAAVVTVGSPTVNTGTNATVTPVAITVIAALPSASLSCGQTVTASTVTVAVALPATTVQLLAAAYYFTPPTTMEHYLPLEDMRLGARIGYPTSQNVLKQGGFYTTYPGSVTDEQIAAAEKAYLGGHEYLLDDAERADLIAAGYGAYITSRVQ